MLAYKKFNYWVENHALKKIRPILKKKGTPFIEEARLPCRVLRPSIEMGIVTPLAWKGFCKRRTSWYWKSERATRFLIVSNIALELPGLGNPIVISESNFEPDRFPVLEEIRELVQSMKFQKNKPRKWDKPDPAEKDFYQRWFERVRANEPFDFDKILLSHSANHANFIDPKYFVILKGAKVPYSIADSIHACSSCLEFFNIIGNQWPLKYVVPCIGAVLFAHLPFDQYFEVEFKRRGLSNHSDIK